MRLYREFSGARKHHFDWAQTQLFHLDIEQMLTSCLYNRNKSS